MEWFVITAFIVFLGGFVLISLKVIKHAQKDN